MHMTWVFNGQFQKKKQWEREYGISWGIKKRAYKKSLEIPSKGDQEIIVWNFQGTWCLAFELSRDLIQFFRIARNVALFYLKFPGVKK